jgi:hypothetical protein
VTEDLRLVLEESRKGQPPVIELDGRYKMIADFEKCFPEGVPSLVRCDSIKISGPMIFEAGVVCEGRLEFVNREAQTGRVREGTYKGGVITL